MSVLQYLNNPSGQSHNYGGRQHVFGSIHELLDDSICMFTIGKPRKNAHCQKDGGYLR